MSRPLNWRVAIEPPSAKHGFWVTLFTSVSYNRALSLSKAFSSHLTTSIPCNTFLITPWSSTSMIYLSVFTCPPYVNNWTSPRSFSLMTEFIQACVLVSTRETPHWIVHRTICLYVWSQTHPWCYCEFQRPSTSRTSDMRLPCLGSLCPGDAFRYWEDCFSFISHCIISTGDPIYFGSPISH